MLTRMAGYDNWKIVALTFPLTLTFGPLFLNLTLGQSGVFLLLSVLLLGEILKNRSGYLEIFALTMWVIASGAKIYPVLWIGCFPLLKRWRTFIIAGALCLTAFGLVAFLRPKANADYWFHFLPNQTREFASGISVDDQSLSGFLSRIMTSNSYTLPGLDVQERREVKWVLPWDFSAQSIRYFSLVLILLLGAGVVFSWIRNNGQTPEGILYSGVLFSLLLFPHMERYNHIVVLPALVWLWKQKALYRHLTVIVYGLFGLSRLNHLWALLPSPIGPLASGFGLLGVLMLLGGLSFALVHSKNPLETKEAVAPPTGL